MSFGLSIAALNKMPSVEAMAKPVGSPKWKDWAQVIIFDGASVGDF